MTILLSELSPTSAKWKPKVKVSVLECGDGWAQLVVDVPGMVGTNLGTSLRYHRGDTMTVEFPEVDHCPR